MTLAHIRACRSRLPRIVEGDATEGDATSFKGDAAAIGVSIGALFFI